MREIQIIILILFCYNKYTQSRSSCHACYDTIGQCGPCGIKYTANAQYCNYKGTQIQTVYRSDWGTCHDCGDRTVDSGTCSCNNGYIGTNCNQACTPGQYAPQGSSVCSICPINTYSGYAAGSCTPCPPYQMSNGGASVCYGMPSSQPSGTPSTKPSDQPSTRPSDQPSSKPSDQPSTRPSSQPSDQPSTHPSSQPTAAPSTVLLETLPFIGYVYLVSVCSFCIIIAWSVFCCSRSEKYKDMNTPNIMYQSMIYVFHIGSQITDVMFVIQLYYLLEQLDARRSHGDKQASMEYDDTQFLFILAIIIKGLLFFVNLLLIQLYGDWIIIVLFELTVPFQCYDSNITEPLWNSIIWWFPGKAKKNNISNIGESDYQDCASLCIVPLCPLQSILYVILRILGWIIKVPVFLCMLFYIATSNLVLFITALSNSELNYTLFGKEENKFYMTLIGLIADDGPQLVVQATYAVIAFTKYHHLTTSIQIASFAFTAWKLTFVVYRKYLDKKLRGGAYDAVDMAINVADKV